MVFLYLGIIISLIGIALMFVMEYSPVGWFVLVIGIYFSLKGRKKLDNN